MRTVAPMTEQFQHFVVDLKETFWGDVYGKAKGVLARLLEEESARLRDQYVHRPVVSVRCSASSSIQATISTSPLPRSCTTAVNSPSALRFRRAAMFGSSVIAP